MAVIIRRLGVGHVKRVYLKNSCFQFDEAWAGPGMGAVDCMICLMVFNECTQGAVQGGSGDLGTQAAHVNLGKKMKVPVKTTQYCTLRDCIGLPTEIFFALGL